MRSTIEVSSYVLSDEITSDPAITGDIGHLFDLTERSNWWRGVSGGEDSFYCRYSTNIDNIPPSVAQVPFILNVLPAVFLMDAILKVDEIDARLYSSIDHIRDRFAAMYPELRWAGKIDARRIVNNHIGHSRKTPVALFSGGVDAVFTALANIAIQPALLTVWGADIFFNSSSGWEVASGANKAFADRFGLEYVTVKSSFRTSISYTYVDREFASLVKDNWWHGFQHGLSLIGIAGPLAYSRGSDKIFIASDYSNKDPYVTRSGSDTTVVQEINFGGISSQVHDYNISRQGKIKFICSFSQLHKVDIPLRVCWKSGSGKNCGVCDKCMRTQFAIMACNHDPEHFGFSLDAGKRAEILDAISNGSVKVEKAAFWKEIVSELRDSSWKEDKIVKSLLSVFSGSPQVRRS